MSECGITPGWVRMMAGYSAWQNEEQIAALESLPMAALVEPRGAFFGSILATVNHLLWADRTWLSRFGAGTAPGGGIAQSTDLCPDLNRWIEARREADALMRRWAREVGQDWLDGSETWHSGVLGREVSRARAMLVTHMFNHATHHRGQVHAMLTAAGARPGDTDLFLMSEE